MAATARPAPITGANIHLRMLRCSYDLDPTAYFAVICAKLNSA